MTQEKWRIFLNQSENMKSIQEILNISDYLNFRILWISEKIANLKKIEKKKKKSAPHWEKIFITRIPGKCLVPRIMLPTDVATSHCGFWAVEMWLVSNEMYRKCKIHTRLQRLNIKTKYSIFFIFILDTCSNQNIFYILS